MIEAKIKAILPYFGGKRTMAPLIVRELGNHRAYWEPFCGSMAVLLAKPPCSLETVCDLNADLTNIGSIIKHQVLGPQFYRRLKRLLVSEAELEECVELLDSTTPPGDEPDLERGIAYFVQSWMMRSGVAGTNLSKRGAGRNIAIRYTPNGGSLSPRWENAIGSIPAWRDRMRHVIIMRRDAFHVLPKIEDATGTVIYTDPPYLKETRSGMNGSGATSRYQHDFDSNSGGLLGDDHTRLADELRRFKKARVVVSYYDHDRLQELYPGWTIVHVDAKKAMVQQSKRGKNESESAPEVLIINGPSFTKVNP